MSTDDTIFLAADGSLSALAGWMSEVLHLERLEDPSAGEGEYLLRGRARTVDGRVVLFVEPNIYGEADPAPGDVSAIDRYAAAVDVRISGSKDEAAQLTEARAIFEDLAQAQSGVAMVLSHAMAWIVAAYLPGAGVHTFPRGTTLDVEDIELWRPWVVA